MGDELKTDVLGPTGAKITVRVADHPDPPVHDYDRLNRAVIVCYDGDGMVLDFVGGHLENETDGTSRILSDLGLDNAPDGISIWEGYYVYSGDPYDGYDSEPSGDFRDPTGEEWEVIKQGGLPWDNAKYQRGPYCDAPIEFKVTGTIDGKQVSYDVCEAHKHWPATRFDLGTELHAKPLDNLGRFHGTFRLTGGRKGCYAERDGWEEEWEAWSKRQDALARGEDDDPT